MKIELSHSNPQVFVSLEEGRKCDTCGEQYWLIEEQPDTSVTQDRCVTCMLAKADKDYLILFDWKIMRSARQLIACRVR